MDNILTQASSSQHKWIAALLSLAMLVCLACVAPVAGQVQPAITPFLPSFATAVILTEGLTAFLLMVQFSLVRAPVLGMLSAAYAFTSVIVIVQILVFPGVFAPAGLLGAGSQSAVWLWVFWHGGFPALIGIAMLAHHCWQPSYLTPHTMKQSLAGFIVLPLLLAAALGYLATRHSDLLPVLISGNDYRQLQQNPIALFVWLLNLATLATVCISTRLRNVLFLWLAVAMLASLIDVTLTLLAVNRYSLGWYAARLISIVSSTVVLGALLWEINRLYRELSRLNQTLFEYTVRDALTGIFNRRHMDRQLDIEIARAKRQHEPLSVLMVDVDHFKTYNDTYGHQQGDACLVAVARVLAQSVNRPADFAARFGGEEFIIVLPNTDLAGAALIAENVRSAVAALAIPSPNGIVTVSIGGATHLPAEILTKESLIATADEALYRAKRNGRNCTFTDPVPQKVNIAVGS